jgi:hypothetical protein
MKNRVFLVRAIERIDTRQTIVTLVDKKQALRYMTFNPKTLKSLGKPPYTLKMTISGTAKIPIFSEVVIE